MVLAAATLLAIGRTGVLAQVAPLAGTPVTVPLAAAVSSVSPGQTMWEGRIAPEAEIVREIDDPHTGDRWLLVRDAAHPGGPGLLRLSASAGLAQGLSSPARLRMPPVIRCGDRVIVEENTPVVEGRLEAQAMGPAADGAPFRARLKIGGRVIWVVAEGPGRALIPAETPR